MSTTITLNHSGLAKTWDVTLHSRAASPGWSQDVPQGRGGGDKELIWWRLMATFQMNSKVVSEQHT